MNGDDPTVSQHVKGHIKWFDPAKGFGFIADPAGGADVLLHANVLRKFGQSSVVDGALVEVLAVRTQRGRQAVEVLSIETAPAEAAAPISDLEALDSADLQALPLLPARVKWFDRAKGFGFANLFGRKGDVFLHVEVLRRWGFADLVAGEAVGMRVVTASRGMVAAQIVAWEKAASEPGSAGESGPPGGDGAATGTQQPDAAPGTVHAADCVTAVRARQNQNLLDRLRLMSRSSEEVCPSAMKVQR